MRKVLFGAFLVTLVAATPARAQQTTSGDRSVQMNIGGGFTMPVSDTSDRFDTGGGFNVGVIFKPASVVGLQGEYGYNHLGGRDITVPLAVAPGAAFTRTGLLESHHSMHYFDFNAIVQTSGHSLFRAYGIGGPGMYYRTISLTTPDVGFTTFCDPFLFVCAPTLTEIDRVIGDRNEWDPGINVGGGVTFNLGDSGALMYVETRWHYIWGDSIIDATGEERNTNGQYWPVTFGFRF